jgi:hypothetical protein
VIRDYQRSDVTALRAIHDASGFDYEFPDLDDPLFVVRKTVEEGGRVVQGLVVKIQGEVYLWLQSDWATPEERWARLVQLTDAAKLAAWARGLDSLTCVIPPEVAESFGKRLEQIGMVADRPWAKYTFDLRNYVPRVESEIAQGENHSQSSP